MQFSAKEDLNVPVEKVMDQLTDFDTIEHLVSRRGTMMERTAGNTSDVIGLAWRITYKFRGKDREMVTEITEFNREQGFTAKFKTGGLEGATKVDVLPLSASKTRLTVTLNMAASTLSGRLLLQSLKLTKGVLNKRFDARIADLVQKIKKA